MTSPIDLVHELQRNADSGSTSRGTTTRSGGTAEGSQRRSPQANERAVDLVVLSDLHLGTRNCQGDAILHYLQSVRPRHVVLCGDVVDIIAKDRNYWPESHMHVIRKIMKFATEGIEVTYITGNHDIQLRQYSGFELGNIKLVDRLELALDGKRTLFIHGDVFDISVGLGFQRMVGGWSYNALMWANRQINWVRSWFGKPPFSLAGYIKRNLGQAGKYIDRFRSQAIEYASEEGFDAIVCGHIHAPRIDDGVDTAGVRYLNSGDWVDSCTALEFDAGTWRLHYEPVVVGRRWSEESLAKVDEAVVSAA